MEIYEDPMVFLWKYMRIPWLPYGHLWKIPWDFPMEIDENPIGFPYGNR